MHHAFGLQVVSSTAWGAQRIEELLGYRRGPARCSPPATARCRSTRSWCPRPGAAALRDRSRRRAETAWSPRSPVPAARCCRRRSSLLEAGDVVHVSATPAGMEALRERAAPARPLMAETGCMFVLIAGGGRTGAQLATFLVSQHHEVAAHRAPAPTSSPTSTASCRRRWCSKATPPTPTSSSGRASARAGPGRLHAGRRRQPGPLLRGAQPLPRSAHHRHHQQPAQRVALRQAVPRGRGHEPGGDPGQPDRAGDVAGRDDDAAEAAPRPLLAGRGQDPARLAARSASPSGTWPCRPTP